MTELKPIITSLSPKEHSQFLYYLELRNKRKDTKNIQLAQFLYSTDMSSTACSETLYGSANSNAYHALRKRLYQSLLDFMANTRLEDESSLDIKVIKLLMAGRALLAKGHAHTAYKVLTKAEHMAQEYHLFSILHEIYHTKIEYAYTQPSLDLELVISNFEQNQKQLTIEGKLNIVYAKTRSALEAIAHRDEIIDIDSLLKDILKTHAFNFEDIMSFKSLYQLISIFGLSAFVTKNYFQIESFLINSYQQIKSHPGKDKQLYYHIQIVYHIANTLFRNKKFEASLHYLETMHELMASNSKKHYPTFEPSYLLLKGLNLNYYQHPSTAIAILKGLAQKTKSKTTVHLDAQLSLAMCYFQQNDLKACRTVLSNLHHSDTWYIKKVGKEWTIKKNLTEILLHIELENIDLVSSLLLRFQRTFFDYLKDIQQERVITFLQFINIYFKTPEVVTSTTFYEKVETAFIWKQTEEEDIFVMSFYAWLKSKMTQQALYETTMQLVTPVSC